MPSLSDDLATVYGTASPDETRNAYDRWAGSYDADNIAKGFRLPGVAAAFVARHVPREARPILDAGCGTGLVGEALSILGYGGLTGLDLSEGMLKTAATLPVYADTLCHDLSDPIPAENDAFAASICIGSFGPGHAPVSTLDELVRVTRPGGHVIFNVRSDTFRQQGFEERMAALAAAGHWRPVDESPDFRVYLLAEPELKVRIFAFAVI